MSAMRQFFRCAVAAVVAATALSAATAPAHAAAGGAVTGTLFDHRDSPLAGATVWLMSDCDAWCPETRTDANGGDRFDDLVPGEDYCVGWESPYDPAFCFTAVDGTFTVPDRQVDTRLLGAIRGTVTDAGGAPLAGATVFVNGSDYLTDSAGGYVVSMLQPRGYEVTAALAGYQWQMTNVTVAADTVTTVDFQLVVADARPSVAFTWSRGDGRLVVGGYAKDDIGVQKIRVAVRDLGVANGCSRRAAGVRTGGRCERDRPGCASYRLALQASLAAGAVRRLAGRGRHGRPAQRRPPSVARRHRPALIPAGEVVSRSDMPA